MDTRCFRCSSTDLVTDVKAGDIICRSCGEVQSDRLIDARSEVLYYAEDSSNKVREARSSGKESDASSSSTIFVGGNEKVREALNRSSQMSEKQSDRVRFNVCEQMRTIAYTLNLNRHITVRENMLNTQHEQTRKNTDSSSSTSHHHFGVLTHIIYTPCESSYTNKQKSKETHTHTHTC